MPTFNHQKRELFVKIVYYGPGLCGKTTNLDIIYARTPSVHRGDMSSLPTQTDRTLFFDYMPLELGPVGGFKCRLQLYTVPGQVFYNATRKGVLKNADGVVFVADSQVTMLEQNLESLANLRENLAESRVALEDIGLVYQWNKRDLPMISSAEELQAALNPRGLPAFEAVAVEGLGVFECLREITRVTIGQIRGRNLLDPGTHSDALSSLSVEDL